MEYFVTDNSVTGGEKYCFDRRLFVCLFVDFRDVWRLGGLYEPWKS